MLESQAPGGSGLTGRIEVLLSRIPWRLLVAALGGVLVTKGTASLLSVDLPDAPEDLALVAKQGMGMVIIGGVILIAAIVHR